MLSHKRAVTRIGCYLLETIDKGLICKVDRSKGLECFVDVDFAGGWTLNDPLNLDNVLSRSEFVIMYAGHLSFREVNFRQKLHCLLVKLSTLHYC